MSGRTLTASAVVAGRRLPPGTLVFLAIALVQTSKDALSRPRGVCPERCLDGPARNDRLQRCGGWRPGLRRPPTARRRRGSSSPGGPARLRPRAVEDQSLFSPSQKPSLSRTCAASLPRPAASRAGRGTRSNGALASEDVAPGTRGPEVSPAHVSERASHGRVKPEFVDAAELEDPADAEVGAHDRELGVVAADLAQRDAELAQGLRVDVM